jgi:hypothetical protein
MSYGLCTLVDMNSVQLRLDEVRPTGNLNPNDHPLLNYVLGPQNVQAFDLQKTISAGDGKLRSVEVRYKQRKLASEVQRGVEGCEASTAPCQLTKDYAFNPENYVMDLELGINALSENPDTNSQMIASEVRLMMDAIKDAMSIDLADDVAANLGGWATDVASVSGTDLTGNILSVNTTLANGTAARIANPVLFEQMTDALRMSRFGMTGVFGGNELAGYVRRAVAGSDSQVGYNLRAMLDAYGVGASYDVDLVNALNAASIGATNVAVGIGSIAPVGHSIYLNDQAVLNQGDSIATTVYDPVTGMMFEYRMTRPCDVWKIVVRARYQFYFLPTDLYKVGDRLRGVTGVAPINVTCDDLTPCQEA